MINIISTQANKSGAPGPRKVFLNLVKGLELIGYPYVVNKSLNATNRLYIHDDIKALYYIKKLKSKIVVGPNLYVLPNEINQSIQLERTLYLHPCSWAIKVWEFVGFKTCPLRAWPVGIDTDAFVPKNPKSTNGKIMVYHKEREPNELRIILGCLDSIDLEYNLINYGQYQESDYKKILQNTLFIIWHGCHESQGIALQEALACNVPILVCDVTKLSQQYGRNWDKSLDSIRVTSAPYFDESCGKKITDLSLLKQSIESMIDNLNRYAPREHILKNLSLEKQAKDFVELWNHWGLTYEQGLGEKAGSSKKWKIPLHEQIFENACRLPRRVIRKLQKVFSG